MNQPANSSAELPVQYEFLVPQCKYNTDASNQEDIDDVPLKVGIDEIGDRLINPNDEALCNEGCDLGFEGEELVGWTFELLHSPPNFPNAVNSFDGATSAIACLSKRAPALTKLAKALQEQRLSVVQRFISKHEQIRPLAGRKMRFYVYDCAQSLHTSNADAEDLRNLKCIFSAELLISWLRGNRPRKPLIDRVTAQVHWLSAKTTGDLQAHKGWSRPAQRTCLQSLLDELGAACNAHPKSAARLGLHFDAVDTHLERIVDPISVFNKAYRHRLAAASDHLPARDRQGTYSHGNLSADICYEVGLLTRSGIEAHDKPSVGIYFQSIFNLSPELVNGIPVNDDLEGSKAFLTVSIKRGMAKIDLEWLLEDGRRPSPITQALYENSARTYYIHFPPFFATALQDLEARVTGGTASVLGQLLSDHQFHPRADILGGSSPYRCTAHRFRQALIAVLLQTGTARMTAALALSQFGMVSPGRVFYGMTRGAHLHQALQTLYRRLGWLGAREKLPLVDQMVGSLAVPTSGSILKVFTSLATAVNRMDEEHQSVGHLKTWVDRNRSVFAYVAAVLEFSLCLRNATGYQLNITELKSPSLPAHVDDKNVREIGGGHPNGKPDLLIRIIAALIKYFEGSLLDQSLHQCEVGKSICNSIQNVLTPTSELNLLANFDLDGNLVEVGTSTWHQALPVHLRLVENFGRQFWPCQIQDAGLGQRHLDYLLRHVLNAWEHGTGQDPVASASVRRQLLTAMDQVIASLALPVPSLLKSSEGAA